MTTQSRPTKSSSGDLVHPSAKMGGGTIDDIPAAQSRDEDRGGSSDAPSAMGSDGGEIGIDHHDRDNSSDGDEPLALELDIKDPAQPGTDADALVDEDGGNMDCGDGLGLKSEQGEATRNDGVKHEDTDNACAPPCERDDQCGKPWGHLGRCVRFKPADRLPFRRTNGYHIVVQVQDQTCCRR